MNYLGMRIYMSTHVGICLVARTTIKKRIMTIMRNYNIELKNHLKK